MKNKIKRYEKSYHEFHNDVLLTPKPNEQYNDSIEGRDTFAGCSFEKAQEYAKSGWDAGLEQLPLEDGIFTGGTTTFVPNVVGSMVNMGAYLNGTPDNMFEICDLREFTLPEMTICVQLNYLANVETSTALKFTKSIVNIVNQFQSTHNVRLVASFDSIQKDKTRHICKVNIKDFDEAFVLNNISFAFHPAFFRRLYFRYIETYKGINSGYGRTTSQELISKEFMTHTIKQGKGIIVPNLNNSNGLIDINDCQKINW